MSLIDQEYILLIINCEKYRNKAILQKTTWLKNIPTYLCYYHVIGDPDLDSEFEFDNEERILWVKTEDDYLSLPKKLGLINSWSSSVLNIYLNLNVCLIA